MIIEQAFISLPEMLLGNHYSGQDYEAGLVSLFSMGILQELNGRNVDHPISHFQAERRYNATRARRVDLYLNMRKLLVTNRRLATYGWRHLNWIEVKFYRNKSSQQRHSTNKAADFGHLVADLLRLTCLVPLSTKDRDSNGRYFLHVYDDEPRYYLPYQTTSWVRMLHTAGLHEVVIADLASSSETAKAKFGPQMAAVQVQATVTNIVNFPIERAADSTHYWCVLSRIDAFSVTHDGKSFGVYASRDVRESEPGAHSQIAAHVNDHLGVSKPSEQ